MFKYLLLILTIVSCQVLSAQPADGFTVKSKTIAPSFRIQGGNSYTIDFGVLFGFMYFQHDGSKTRISGSNLGISTGYVVDKNQMNFSFKNTYQLGIPMAIGFQYQHQNDFSGSQAHIIEPLAGYSSYCFKKGARLQYGILAGYPIYLSGSGRNFPINFHLNIVYHFPL